MKKEMKSILKRMIKYNGFIAKGVYSEGVKYWQDNTNISMSIINMSLFHQLKVNGYIKQDRTGKYYPTEKGRDFVMPWYKRIFN